MLRLLAQKMRVGIRKNENAAMPSDGARLASRIAGQARVSQRIDVSCADILSGLEAGARIRLGPHKITAITRARPRGGSAKSRRFLLRSGGGLARLQFLPGHQTALHQQFRGPRQPFLVITHPQVIRWGKQFNTMPASIDVPLVPGASGAFHRIHPAFPRCMKHGFVFLMLDGSHVLHPAHVMDAVHALAPSTGATFPAPIMASRATRAASSCSVIFSVPAGLSGSTR